VVKQGLYIHDVCFAAAGSTWCTSKSLSTAVVTSRVPPQIIHTTTSHTTTTAASPAGSQVSLAGIYTPLIIRVISLPTLLLLLLFIPL